eukprot:XP_011672250.1 PREDICTED: uncharacterized protein LOC105442117 [Strongylocentrotus purpuratus]
MADNFSSPEDICEGENCEAIADVTYYVKEKKKLCEGCIGRARKATSMYRVDVAVDQDAMIIAVECGQSKIYVINPADGKIIKTITCKQNIMMHGVLSSGHIIAQPYPRDHRLFIIDRQGAQREIPHSDVILNACLDPMTDDLYVVTSDDEYKTCVIDQVMSGGDMKKRRVASFPLRIYMNPRDERMSYIVNILISMAANFSSAEDICEGENCEAIADVTYYVKEKKKLCEGCIGKARKDKDREEEDAAKINQEIDDENQKLREEIRKNDEEREKRLELNRTNAEKRRETIDNKQNDT